MPLEERSLGTWAMKRITQRTNIGVWPSTIASIYPDQRAPDIAEADGGELLGGAQQEKGNEPGEGQGRREEEEEGEAVEASLPFEQYAEAIVHEGPRRTRRAG